MTWELRRVCKASLSAPHSCSSCWFSLLRLSLSEMCLASMSRISAACSSCICAIFSSYPTIICSSSWCPDGSVCTHTLTHEELSDCSVELLRRTDGWAFLVLLFVPWCSPMSPFFLGWDGGSSLDLAKAVWSSWILSFSSAMAASLTWERHRELYTSPPTELRLCFYERSGLMIQLIIL